MKTLTTTYKTRNGEGTVTITKEGCKRAKASFDGLESIEVSLACVKGVVGIFLNLKDLNAVGFNAPAINQKAIISLPEFGDVKKLQKLLKEEAPKGKICGDNVFRTYEDLKGLSYSEQVLAGEYTE